MCRLECCAPLGVVVEGALLLCARTAVYLPVARVRACVYLLFLRGLSAPGGRASLLRPGRRAAAAAFLSPRRILEVLVHGQERLRVVVDGARDCVVEVQSHRQVHDLVERVAEYAVRAPQRVLADVLDDGEHQRHARVVRAADEHVLPAGGVGHERLADAIRVAGHLLGEDGREPSEERPQRQRDVVVSYGAVVLGVLLEVDAQPDPQLVVGLLFLALLHHVLEADPLVDRAVLGEETAHRVHERVVELLVERHRHALRQEEGVVLLLGQACTRSILCCLRHRLP